VPVVREKSPLRQIINEVKQRISDGYQEVVLTGTEIGRYNDDGVNLKILEKLLAETEMALVSSSSTEVNPELLYGKTCGLPPFPLSLQASDTVLRDEPAGATSDYRRSST
jgi:tRNA A37 methylthiotransferase MiaB